MSAFEKTKASKRGLQSECEFGNAILFRMFRKKSLQPWSRGIIWSEVFLKDYTGYYIENRLLGHQLGGYCKKYYVV